MPFVPNSDADRKLMLEKIGVNSFEELITFVPSEIRYKGLLNLPKQLSEYEVVKLLDGYSRKNKSASDLVCFMGGGAYDRFVPTIVGDTINRPEFRTAYTPYQAEVSQGTLQAMYEFQSMISELTQMDVANASLYDGASSLAEACLMSHAQNNKTKVLIAGSLHPNYKIASETICSGRKIEFEQFSLPDGTADLEALSEAMKNSDNITAVVVQNPNYYGNIEEVFEIEKIAHSKDALFIVVVEPISLGMIEPPGKYNADVVVGEGQPLGISLSYGGPYLGIFACKKELIRKLPGRIAGMTKDLDGNRAFVLTLQTREQQIKREKATSNICTNQGLFMLAATIYMETMGKEGIRQVGKLSYQAAHYLADKIKSIPNYSLLNDKPFLFEFTVKTPTDPETIFDEGVKSGFLPGISTSLPDGGKGLVIAVTEKRDKVELDNFVDFLKKF